MQHDLLSDVMVNLKNYERSGRSVCTVRASKLVKEVLAVMQKEGYISKFESVDTAKGRKYKVSLTGRINNCNVIKPRFSVKLAEFENREKEYLPAKDFGILIVSTPYGVMSHKTALEKKTGGKLLAFVY